MKNNTWTYRIKDNREKHYRKLDIDKLDINKLVNDPNNLNNLKTKVDDLDVGNLKLFPKIS